MFNKKKYFYLVLMFFFMTTSFSFHAYAEEGVKKTDRQSSEGQQKQSPQITIKSSKIDVILDGKTSGKQKAGIKQKQTPGIKIKDSKTGIVPDRKKTESKKEQVTEGKKPHITFDTMEYNVGEVWEGAVISHGFTVKNTGDAVLKINKVKPG